MKIEVGESLFYSWLRHIEKCQVVQLNWKVSATWELHNQEKIQSLHLAVKEHFFHHSEYKPFSNDVRLTQRIKQTELDAIGVSIHNGAQYVYAGEIAFHESGLNYGGKEGTVNKILEKVTRAAMCLIGYIGIEDGDIIFASPKINPMILKELQVSMEQLEMVFLQQRLPYKIRLIANDDFHKEILEPVTNISGNIADTSELFLRAYQLNQMFRKNK